MNSPHSFPGHHFPGEMRLLLPYAKFSEGVTVAAAEPEGFSLPSGAWPIISSPRTAPLLFHRRWDSCGDDPTRQHYTTPSGPLLG